MSDSDGWEITDDQERARKGPKADATLSKFFKAGKYMRKCKRKDHKCLKCDWFVPAARAHNGVLRNHLLHDCPNMSPLERMQVRADNADKMVTGREVQSMLSQPSKKQKQADIRSMIADSTITRLSHDARNAANEYWLRFFVTELQDEEGIPPPQPVLPVQPPGGFATWTEAVFDAIGPWGTSTSTCWTPSTTSRRRAPRRGRWGRSRSGTSGRRRPRRRRWKTWPSCRRSRIGSACPFLVELA
jgi:hypothetical protein